MTLPKSYRAFLQTFGTGTYNGVICVNAPDDVVLKEFAEHEFWELEGAPITQEQIGQCIALANSIDGDFLAIHADVDGLILLPRHSDKIEVFKISKGDFRVTLDAVCIRLYSDYKPTECYFGSYLNVKHKFMRHYPEDGRPDIVRQFKASFKYDFLIEGEYACLVFLSRLGGYVRFNYGGFEVGAISMEVVVVYDDDGRDVFNDVMDFLRRHKCIET